MELLSALELGLQPELVRTLFKFMDGDGRLLALVGERTVPIARVAAGPLRQAPRPLRLCYLGPIFASSPPPGGRREAFQAGAELIGAAGPTADAEVVAMAVRALEAAGVRDFQVEVGHVGFFGGIVQGLPESKRAGVRAALWRRDLVSLEHALEGSDLADAERDLVLRFPSLRGGPELLEAASSLIANPASVAALGELQEVYRLVGEHHVGHRVNLDLGAVRDIDYYTSIVFEVFAPGLGSPVAVGGRYDRLLSRVGRDEPATGFVIFIDRVQELLS